jgi:5-methyltetrahydropteroyltriglutamate--homocysteine methyltransferase
MADDYGYHIDHHGSLVRPPALLAARAGGASTPEGSALENKAAIDAAEQEAAVSLAHALRRLTLSAVCDGQYRRAFFESVAYDGIDGFAPANGPAPLSDLAGIPAARRRAVSATPVATGRLAQAEVAPVLATVDRPVFVTLPSAGYLAAVGGTTDPEAVQASGAALAAILAAELEALAADGAVYVALANPLYVPLLTVAGRSALTASGIDADAVLTALVAADRATITGLSVPAEFRVGLYLTDSGPLPTTGEGYDKAAVATLLELTPQYHRIGVDWPADPATRFPAELVKPGVVISLGAVDVSTAEPETVQELLDRIDGIAADRGEGDIAVATNGGFAQVADQPLMGEEQQHAKLELVEMVSRYYWGNEI